MQRGRRNRYWFIAAAALAIISIAIPVLVLTRPLPPPRVVGTTPITNDRRAKFGPFFTDGLRIYFNAGSLLNSQPYQVSVKGGESFSIPIQLKNTWLQDISPDHSEFLIRTYTVQGITFNFLPEPLWIAPVLGGSPRRLGDLASGDAAWSPDGQRIVYAGEKELDLALSDGTGTRRLVAVPGSPSFLRWSPDGKKIRFTLARNQLPDSLWEISSDGGHLHALLPAWQQPHCCGNWTTDGKYFVFQVTSHPPLEGLIARRGIGAPGGIMTIWAIRENIGLFERANNKPVQLTSGPVNTYAPVPSPDGKRLFVGGHQPRSEMVRYDRRSKAFVPFLSGASVEGLDFSRDGNWVTYVSYPEGTLWRSTVNGEERLQLTTPPMHVGQPQWSPDGKRIAFMGQYPEKPWRIFMLPAEGGAPEQLTTGENATGFDPTWSPDGESLAVAGFPGEKLIIHILNLRTHQISALPQSDGLFSPHWSPDGRYVAALSADSFRLLIFNVQSGRWTELAKANFGYPTWSRNSEYIYFDTVGVNTGFFRVRVRDRKVERILGLEDVPRAVGTLGPWTGLAPDGSPLFQRDASVDEIYALDWEAP
jgi:Tol biopolymer transport system component